VEAGCEFASSGFISNHPEAIDRTGPIPANAPIDITTNLNSDSNIYGAYPNGIPQGTSTATFCVKQISQFVNDTNIDGVSFSNDFGTLAYKCGDLEMCSHARGYSNWEAGIINDFFMNLKTDMGSGRIIYYIDIPRTTQVRHDNWSFPDSAYQYIDYWCVNSPWHHATAVLPDMASAGKIPISRLGGNDYIADPWYGIPVEFDPYANDYPIYIDDSAWGHSWYMKNVIAKAGNLGHIALLQSRNNDSHLLNGDVSLGSQTACLVQNTSSSISATIGSFSSVSKKPNKLVIKAVGGNISNPQITINGTTVQWNGTVTTDKYLIINIDGTNNYDSQIIDLPNITAGSASTVSFVSSGPGNEGVSAECRIFYNFDNEVPVISTNLDDNDTVNTSYIMLEGQIMCSNNVSYDEVLTGATPSLKINGEVVPVSEVRNPPGTPAVFSKMIVLNQGLNQVILEAKDWAGNTSVKTLNITYSPGSLTSVLFKDDFSNSNTNKWLNAGKRYGDSIAYIDNGTLDIHNNENIESVGGELGRLYL